MEGSLHTHENALVIYFMWFYLDLKKTCKSFCISLHANRLHPSRHRAVHAKIKEEAQTVDSQWPNPLRHHEVILQITTFSESLSQML